MTTRSTHLSKDCYPPSGIEPTQLLNLASKVAGLQVHATISGHILYICIVLVPLPYSSGSSSRYFDRLHDFYVHIPRCYKDVIEMLKDANSFFLIQLVSAILCLQNSFYLFYLFPFIFYPFSVFPAPFSYRWFLNNFLLDARRYSDSVL